MYIYTHPCARVLYAHIVIYFPTYKPPFLGEVHLPRFQATVVSYNSAISASVASSVVDDMGFAYVEGAMRMGTGWVFH